MKIPEILILLVIAAIAAEALVRWQRKRNKVVPVVDEPKQKPLPASLLPEIQPATVPEHLVPHLFELVAHTINSGAVMKNFDLRDLGHQGHPLGSWRVTVEKIED